MVKFKSPYRSWLVAVPAALSLLSPTVQAQTTITNGLVAYWNFDGNLLDSIKNFHGTARGTAPIPFVEGRTNFGEAIKLNGDDQFVEITGGNENELEFPGGSMSIAGWFKVDAFDTSWQALISKGEGSNYRVARRSAEGGIAYAGGATDTPTGRDVNDGQWHHFTAITDATMTNLLGFGTALYIDGTLDTTIFNPPVLASSDFNLMIGENPGARGREWEGEIDDIGIWNRVLSEAEIMTLATNGPISSYLPATTNIIYLSGLSQTSRAFTFGISDLDTSVLDPTTVTLTIDGQAAPVTSSKAGLLTTFVHNPATAWVPGSTHTYAIQARDTLGRQISDQGSFTLPMPWFPTANLPGPNITNKAWALRWIFGAGTINDIGNVLTQITNIGTANFTGAYVDTTSEVINHVGGGLFAGNLPIPDEVLNHASGLWSGEDYILYAVGNIEIPEEGDYTFGVHSDDGFAYRIRGGQTVSVSGAGQLDPVDPETVVHPNNTGDSNTRAVFHLKKGVYRVEWFFWERGGGDNGEFYSAKGAFANDADTDQWTLVGDNTPSVTFNKPGVDTNGWTVVSSDPGGDQLVDIGSALNDLSLTGGAPTNHYDALLVGDPESNAGVAPFPKNTPAADDDFALRCTANLVVLVAGTYEIGFDSDDGGWMKMPGQTFTEIVQNATGLSALVGTDEVWCDTTTGSSLTTVKVDLTAGSHPIEIGFFERGGGAFVRGLGAQFGAPRLATLEKGGAGTFTTPAALTLTDQPAGVVESLRATISRSGNNVMIQWSPTGGTLQSTPSLDGTPVWTNVGTDNPTTLTIGTSNMFFRVQQ